MKKLTILLTVLILSISAAAATDPVAHWKLDEAGGPTAYDSAGTNDGTLIASPVWTAGQIDGALELDGDDYVEMDVTNYKGVLGTQSRTCAAWIKTTETGAIISWGDSDIGGGWWLFRIEGAGRLRLQSQGGFIVGSTDLRDNNWHHVIALLDSDGTPDNNEVKLYVDGFEEIYSEITSQPIDTASHSNVTIGASCLHDGTVVVPFNGLIDDVRIYDRALCTEEVKQLYESQLGNLEITPIDDFVSSGNTGGPFVPVSKDYQLTNNGDDILSWDVQYSDIWLDVSDMAGTLNPNESAMVTVSINATADTLAGGVFTDTLVFGDTTEPSDIVEYKRDVNLGIGVDVPYLYPTIQLAINAAVNGDTIIVADGTYTGDGNRDIDFLGKAITVRSANGPENCIIDCQGTGRGFYFHNGEIANSILDGFTITNGFALSGGAIKFENSSPLVNNCRLIYNYAYGEYDEEHSGGAFICINSSPIVSGCIISNNTARYQGNQVYCKSGNALIQDCNFTGKELEVSGGNPVIRGCTFISTGIAIDITSFSKTYCIIENNIIKSSQLGIYLFENRNGGMLGSIRNNVIVGIGDKKGYGILYRGSFSKPEVVNNIITNLKVGIDFTYNNHDNERKPKIKYNNMWGNWLNGTSQSTPFDLTGIQGNISTDPLFVDADNDDFHLSLGSPCIDVGDNSVVEANSTDLDGNPRIINGIVDMGAYEAIPPSTEATMNFTPTTLNCSSEGNWVKAHFVLPEGFSTEDVDTAKPATIDSLTCSSDHMNVSYNEGLVEVEVAFSRNDFCSIGLFGNTELTVRGWFIDETAFYGTDTIRITTNQLEKLPEFLSYWLQTDCTEPDFCEGFDLDHNGVVDLADFVLLAEN